MATESKALPRAKDFKFRVEFNGFPVALVESFNPGKESVGITKAYGGGMNHAYKEVGMLEFGNVSLTNTVPIEGPGRRYWQDWMIQCQDARTGNGLNPDEYMRDFSLYELDNTGTPFRVIEFYGAFIADYDIGDKTASSMDKNVIEKVEVAYQSRETRYL